MTTLTKAERRRAFIRETAGVVLGVLIALTLGAIATWVGWRMDADEARRALALELGEIIGQGEERVLAKDCLEERFDKLAVVLDGAAASGQLPPLGDIGDPPFRTWSRGVWDSTISADIASHMDREALDNLSGVYEFVAILNREAEAEHENWTTLYTMVGPGRSITQPEVGALRAALTRLRMAHRMIVISAVRLRQVADAYDLAYDRGTVAEYATYSLGKRYCAPLPPPSGVSYGAAPFSQAYQRIIANPITRERDTGAEKAAAAPPSPQK